MAENKGGAVSLQTLANLFDCDVRTIQNLAKDGVVIKAGRGEYVLAASIRNYVRHLRGVAAGRTGSDESIDAITEGAKLKREQRRNYELKNAILEGQAVRIEDIQPAWARVARTLRAAVLAIPSKTRYSLPHMTPEDQSVLEQICRDQLEDAAVTDEAPTLEAGAAQESEETDI